MAYTIKEAIADTRRHLKDTSENVWTDVDIVEFVNEAINIVKSTIPEYFTDLITVIDKTDTTPININSMYVKMLSLFASSRCFDQDEQYYRATNKMNEFEARRGDMEIQIRDSKEYADKIALDDPDGSLYKDYVVDEYYAEPQEINDPDAPSNV
jgi:hypothetical protein